MFTGVTETCWQRTTICDWTYLYLCIFLFQILPCSECFYWVTPWRLNFVCRRFGTICLFHLHRRVCIKNGWRWWMLGYLYWKRVWLENFRAKTFSLINNPTSSTPVILHTYPPMKMEQTDCSETSAYKIQTPGNYPGESIQHLEHGRSLKSRINHVVVSKRSKLSHT